MDPREAALKEVMSKNPVGLVVMAAKRQVTATFWTDRETPEGVMLENLIGGIAAQAVEKGKTTKAGILHYLERIIK